MRQEHLFRIGIVAQGGRDWIGGVEYTKNLVRSLIQQRDVRHLHLTLVFHHGMDKAVFDEILPAVDDVVSIGYPKRPNNPVKARLKDVLKRLNLVESPLFSLSRLQGFDFVFPVPAHQAFGRFRNWAGWIPDFQHRALPRFFSQSEISIRDRQYAQLIRRAPRLILSSRSAEQDLKAYFHPHSNVEVLSFCTKPPILEDSESTHVVHKYRLPHKFLLVSNQFWAHKNHETLFRAIAELKAKGLDIPLVCTGGVSDYRDPQQSSRILDVIHKLGIADQVYILGLVPKPEQVQLLRAAAAVVQPSLFEGWSTVVEDAKALGKHLFISDLPVHREQNPASSDYFDPGNATALAEAISAKWPLLVAGPQKTNETQGLKVYELAWKDFERRVWKVATDPLRA